ncbi:MAG: sialidase family protein, partial [Candidatus Omnitrophota bacterium]
MNLQRPIFFCIAFRLLAASSVGFAAEQDPLKHVVHFSPPCTGIYLGSPTLVRLDNGDILAAMDQFGPGAPRSSATGRNNMGLLFRSKNNGETWRFVTCFETDFWASLFIHKGAVYYLGCSEEYGSIVIRKSEDNGETWTKPIDAETGLLFSGTGGQPDGPNYHCAPMPVVEHKGRLYRAFENCAPPSWPAGFRALVISADADADLLKASSWIMSNHLIYDQETDPPEFAKGAEHLPGGKAAGWLEGNIVIAPDGRMFDILRANSLPVADRAAMVLVEDKGRKVSFDPKTGFIEFPGGMSKFSIRRDPQTGVYWTLANNNTNPA